MFTEWLENSFTHTLLLSPLMGIFFGALFSGLTRPPTEHVPKTIIQTKEVYRERVIYRKRQHNSSSDDGRGLVIFLGVGLLILIWQYAIWAESVHYYLEFLLLSVIGFSSMTTVVSVIKGQFTSKEWWVYVIFPLIILLFSICLLNEARVRFDPQLTELAKENSWWYFYTKSLTDYGRSFLISHVIGVVLLSLLVLITSLMQIHYLSLMNQRITGRMQALWSLLVRVTDILSGRKGIAFCLILAVMAFLLINEYVAHWISS